MQCPLKRVNINLGKSIFNDILALDFDLDMKMCIGHLFTIFFMRKNNLYYELLLIFDERLLRYFGPKTAVSISDIFVK